jgi:hypothetical protein
MCRIFLFRASKYVHCGELQEETEQRSQVRRTSENIKMLNIGCESALRCNSVVPI